MYAKYFDNYRVAKISAILMQNTESMQEATTGEPTTDASWDDDLILHAGNFRLALLPVKSGHWHLHSSTS